MKKIILASGSPRRNRMLSRLGIPFIRMVVDSDEKNRADLSMETFAQVAMENALAKARKAFEEIDSEEESVIIGADTIVVFGRDILPKPTDRNDARRMLKQLSGKTHSVITGIALVLSPHGKIFTDYEETKVTFRDLTNEEINLYVASNEPMDKAGAYGIQGFAAFLVEKVEGDYPNVVGLPLLRLYNLMKKAGVDLFRLAIESSLGAKQ
ncbi:MAG: Maf family protein [Vulcanimicrobiota bacterium]